MANNDVALFWSKHVRGLTIAEHAILEFLAAFHDKQTKTCRVRTNSLKWRFEASRAYLRGVLYQLQRKGFIEIEMQFGRKGLQESNNFRLDTDRLFPKDEGHSAGLKILNLIREQCSTDEAMRDGFQDAWVEELPKRHKQDAKPTLHVAVASDVHLKALDAFSITLERKLADPKNVGPVLARHYDIKPLWTYLKK